MPSTLSDRIATLATRFADAILRTVRESVDAQIEAGAGRSLAPVMIRLRGGRRSAEAISVLADRVLSEVRRHVECIRAEVMRANVGIERSDIGRSVLVLLSDGRIRKTGENRRTSYFATGKAGTEAEP